MRWTRKSFYTLRGRGLLGTIRSTYASTRKTLYGYFLRAPGVRGQVDKQVSNAITDLEHKLVPSGPGVTRYLTVPKEGWTADQVRAELERLAEMEHTKWEDGRVSGAVYHGGRDLLRLQFQAMEMFGVANPIHPDLFPGVRKMEAEVVAMVRMTVTTGRDSTDKRSRCLQCSTLHQLALVSVQVVEPSQSSWHVYLLDEKR